ncbi:MAG TPA: hypothetical protein VM165_09400, partial [Planctomycetaceae bacterium]|nr:hypothetical protein [Planctomycetaceae bacterium]
MRRQVLVVGVIVAILALGVWLVQPKPVAVAMFYVRAEPSIFESAPYTELSPEDVARFRKHLIKSLT